MGVAEEEKKPFHCFWLVNVPREEQWAFNENSSLIADDFPFLTPNSSLQKLKSVKLPPKRSYNTELNNKTITSRMAPCKIYLISQLAGKPSLLAQFARITDFKE